MDKINELADSLLTSIENKDKKHTAPYDTRAEIRNIKDGVAWVHIPGGVDETPVDLTMNANIGDIVQIRVSGGRAWITGNATAPPTDDTRANAAYGMATDASELSSIAARAADEAQQYAGEAKNMATEATSSAGVAKKAADSAMKGLGQVEDVVGTLNWITAHSKVTEDTTPTAGKSYYIKNQDGTFTLVTDVEGKNPAQEGWYELTEAVQNYILSHLALTNDGLYVMKDDSHWKVRISDEGVHILDDNNEPINQMTNTGNIMGYLSKMHTITDQDSIEFHDGENSLGYVGNSKLLFASAEFTTNLYVTNKYVWRKTPTGAIGLYLR